MAPGCRARSGPDAAEARMSAPSETLRSDQLGARDLGHFGYAQQLSRRVGTLRVVRGRLLVRLHPHHRLPAVRSRLRLRRYGVLLDLAGRPCRSADGGVVLRRTRRPVPVVRRDLPVGPPPRRRCRRLVRGLDDGDRADHHAGRRRDRAAGRAAGGLDRLPAGRHRSRARLEGRRGERRTARLSAARRHHDAQRDQRPDHRDRELGRRDLRARRRRADRHLADSQRRARSVRRPAHDRTSTAPPGTSYRC